MNHDSILEDWRQHAEQHDDENYWFLHSLKFRRYGFAPDKLASELHQRVFEIVDCTRCANCCKTLETKLTDEEIARIAAHLKMTIAAFSETYLSEDDDGDPAIRQLPCPFLGDDNLCTIYDVRPAECREYPHTNKPGFTTRTIGLAGNAQACPAVFWIVEQMRSQAESRRKGRRRRSE